MKNKIKKKENPLKELFGFGKDNKITKEDFINTRILLGIKNNNKKCSLKTKQH